jgi:hypothetical protein
MTQKNNCWNIELVNHIANYLGAPQKNYVVGSQDKIEINRDIDPFELKLTSNVYGLDTDKLTLVKMDMVDSLYHSILFLTDDNYKTYSSEIKNTLISNIKNKSPSINVCIIEDNNNISFMGEYKQEMSCIFVYRYTYDYYVPIVCKDKDYLSKIVKTILDNLPSKDSKLTSGSQYSSSSNKDVGIEVNKYAKLTLTQLQEIAIQHKIDIKKPASKKDTFKNKTKQELVEEITQKTQLP